MNARDERGVGNIKDPFDATLYRALDILHYFTKWRSDLVQWGVEHPQDNIDIENNFFGREIWADLNGMVCVCAEMKWAYVSVRMCAGAQ